MQVVSRVAERLRGALKLTQEKKKRKKDLRNQEIPGKSQCFIELQRGAQFSSQNEFFFNTIKKLLKNIN